MTSNTKDKHSEFEEIVDFEVLKHAPRYLSTSPPSDYVLSPINKPPETLEDLISKYVDEETQSVSGENMKKMKEEYETMTGSAVAEVKEPGIFKKTYQT